MNADHTTAAARRRLAALPGSLRAFETIFGYASDAHAIVAATSDAMTEARGRAQTAEARIRQLLTDEHVLSHGGEKNQTVIAARAQLTNAQEDIARLQARYERAGQRFQRWRAARQSVEEFLAKLPPDSALSQHEPPIVELEPAENPAGALERVRADIDALEADRRRVLAAPLKSAAAVAVIRAELDRLATAGAPSFWRTIEAGLPPEWPTESLRGGITGLLNGGAGGQVSGYAATSAFAALPFIVWLLRDGVEKRLVAELASVANDPAALTAEERSERLIEIADEMLSLERQEAVLMAEVGDAALPRDRMDPRALLHLDGPAPQSR